MTMSNPANNKSNLRKLIDEKHELQTLCATQEKLIGLKFDELRNNFPEIIGNEILPYRDEKNNNVLSILDIANDIIFRFLPPHYRKSMFARIALKVIQVFIIRSFRKKSENKELKK